MNDYLDNLLQLSQITSAPLELEDVSLSWMAENIAAKFQRAQPNRRLELVIEPDLTVTGDHRLLYLALEKLLENAFKFTAQRPLSRIEFGLARSPDRTAYFVKDNGIGFDMKYANKLFIPFQTAFAEGIPGRSHGTGDSAAHHSPPWR